MSTSEVDGDRAGRPGINLQTALFEDVEIVPMGITRVDSVNGCVAALALDGRWLRPGPVAAADLTGPQPRYRYRHRLLCRLEPAPSSDSRPEDRNLFTYPYEPPLSSGLSESEWLALCSAHCDRNVATSFSGLRSIGLVAAVPQRIYLQRSTQQRLFVRMDFMDPAGASYDWIVPDIAFSQLTLALSRAHADLLDVGQLLLQQLRALRIFLCLGLTKPNHRFPGVFRGCHPLIVGVHTFPDYGPLFATELPGCTAPK